MADWSPDETGMSDWEEPLRCPATEQECTGPGDDWDCEDYGCYLRRGPSQELREVLREALAKAEPLIPEQRPDR